MDSNGQIIGTESLKDGSLLKKVSTVTTVLNYKEIAKVFRKMGWKWFQVGIPNEQDIQRHVNKYIVAAVNLCHNRNCKGFTVSSGRFSVRVERSKKKDKIKLITAYFYIDEAMGMPE